MRKFLLTLGATIVLSAVVFVCALAADGVLNTPQNVVASTKPRLVQTRQEVVPSVPAEIETAPPLLTGERVVLRLPYKGAQPNALLHPEQISLYFEQNESFTFHQGSITCTDWQGNIYVYDPVLPSKGLIKKFDKNGKLVHTFELPPMHFLLNAAVTRKGTLWVAIGTPYARDKELPVLAFRAEDTKPFLDWRFNVPEQLKQAARKTNKQETEEPNIYWGLDGVMVGATKVRVYTSYSYDDVKGTPVDLWVDANGDAPSELQIEVVPKSQKAIGSPIAPDNSQWFITTGELSWDWENDYLWKQGQPQGIPLIRRSELLVPKSWWQKTFAFQKDQSTPALFLDGNSNIYQAWDRQADGPARKFYMGSGVEEMRPKASEGEKALVVLNSQRQPIGYLPWTLCYFELSKNWIFPLPDGSGFYRQEYTPKELVVYFYPLPKSKTQEPQ